MLDRFAREHRGFHIPVEAPPSKPSLAERVRRPLRHLSRPLPAALAGAAAAAAITATLLVLPQSGDNSAGRDYQASLSGSALAPSATATADLRVLDNSGTRVKLSVRGLKGNPASVYELWCLRDDGSKISAGTFRTDGSGRADVSLTTAAVPGEYHRLSIERKGLTPATATGQRVMTGEILYPQRVMNQPGGNTMKRTILCAAIATFAVAGCGSSNNSSSNSSTASSNTTAAPAPAATTPKPASSGGGGASSNLQLSADSSGQLKFDKTSLSTKAGNVTITMDNPSPLGHAVAVEGNGVDKNGSTVQMGGKSTVTVSLKPGKYTFYCPVDGHRAAGMQGTLTVK